jgi:hypothetical protein
MVDEAGRSSKEGANDSSISLRQAGHHLSWERAAVISTFVLVVSILAFMIIPNQLIAYLSARVDPTARDLLVTLWWAMSLVACGWLFVRVQGGERKGGV